MYIKEIKWLDQESKEAMLTVASDGHSLTCFSHPCSYKIGDVLTEPLECLDTDDVILCEKPEEDIEKLGKIFNYRICGRIKSKDESILEVYGFNLHLDKNKIPNDINEGAYIQFLSSRIDIW